MPYYEFKCNKCKAVTLKTMSLKLRRKTKVVKCGGCGSKDTQQVYTTNLQYPK